MEDFHLLSNLDDAKSVTVILRRICAYLKDRMKGKHYPSKSSIKRMSSSLLSASIPAVNWDWSSAGSIENGVSRI